jgi:hypothetical protein
MGVDPYKTHPLDIYMDIGQCTLLEPVFPGGACYVSSRLFTGET